MPASIYKPTRYPPQLHQAIEESRRDTAFSKWIKEAATMRLEHEQGLTPEYAKQLAVLNREITALGRNLNQLARAAQSSHQVTVDKALMMELGGQLRQVKKEVSAVRAKLLL